MHFQKFVKRSTKGLFIFITAVMVLSLVLWGYVGTDVDEDKGDAGVIFDTVTVTRKKFNDHGRRTIGHMRYRLMKENEQVIKLIAAAKLAGSADKVLRVLPTRFAHVHQLLAQLPPDYWDDQRFLPGLYDPRRSRAEISAQTRDLKESDRNEKTWEFIILLQDAADRGIRVSDEEAEKAKEDFVKRMAPGLEDAAAAEKAAADFLNVKADFLTVFFREALTLDRLFDLVTQSEFCTYSTIFDELLAKEDYGRAMYAAFNPKEYLKILKPIRTNDIENYYEKNKATLKLKPRVQVLYLTAEFEEFRKLVPDPTDTEIQAYYDKNKDPKFIKHREDPGHGQPGHHHDEDEGKEKEFKPIQEVRDEIVKLIKQDAADAKALKVMEEVEVVIKKTQKEQLPGKIRDRLRELGFEWTADLAEKVEKAVRETEGADAIAKKVVEILKSGAEPTKEAEAKIGPKVVERSSLFDSFAREVVDSLRRSGLVLKPDVTSKVEKAVWASSVTSELSEKVLQVLAEAGLQPTDPQKKALSHTILHQRPVAKIGEVLGIVVPLEGGNKIEEAWARSMLAEEIVSLFRQLMKAGVTLTAETSSKLSQGVQEGLRFVHHLLFQQIKEEWATKGTKLSDGITVPFDSEGLAGVEESVGKATPSPQMPRAKLGDWGFDEKRKEGDGSPRFKTEKGYVYFRIQNRKEKFSDQETIIARQDTIKGALHRERLRERAKQAATDFAQEINLHGLSAARKKYPFVDLRSTEYFKLDGRTNALPQDNSSLGTVLNAEAQKLEVSRAGVFEGSQTRKTEWSFVAFLDDRIERPPQGEEAEFEKLRELETLVKRFERRESYVQQTVADAHRKDLQSPAPAP